MPTKWAILILILAGLLAYGNTAKNGLFWDDDEFITRNAYIRSFRYLPQWFSQPLTAGAGVNSNYYRPLLQLSFAIDYKLWGLWPAGYHLENMLWHTTAAILLFIFLSVILSPAMTDEGSRLPRPFGARNDAIPITKTIAFATSLLWLIHPAHVEAVAYANSRGDSMAAAFILLSLILWMPPYGWSPVRVKKRFWASAAVFVLALLSKEFAIITPGLMALISFVNLTNGKLTKLPIGTKNLLIMFSIAAVYIALRLTVLNFQNTLNFYGVDLTKVDQQQPFARYATSLPIRLMTFLKVLPIYAGILIWPSDLHMERTVEIPTSFYNLTVISVVGLLILIGLLGYWLFAIRKNRLPMFALGWFFISILPVSGLIPISQILAEHFLYLPSIGFFLLVGWLIVTISNTLPKMLNDSNHLTFTYLVYWIILLLIAIPLFSKTIHQNRIWRDPITFYEYTLTRAQPTARVYNNLAMAYAETRNPQKAISNYNKAISLGDVYPNPHYNLGNTFIEIGETEKAEDEYKKALKIDPGFHYATLKLGQIYINQGKIDAAKNLVCPVFPAQPLCL